MRVRVTLSLDIDPDAWALAYGDMDAAAMRADVRQYVLTQLQECAAAAEGGIREVQATVASSHRNAQARS